MNWIMVSIIVAMVFSFFIFMYSVIPDMIKDKEDVTRKTPDDGELDDFCKAVREKSEAFAKAEMKIFPSSKDSDFEWGEKGGRMFIRMKSHVDPTHCTYCGSRNISDFTCNQCGAPAR